VVLASLTMATTAEARLRHPHRCSQIQSSNDFSIGEVRTRGYECNTARSYIHAWFREAFRQTHFVRVLYPLNGVRCVSHPSRYRNPVTCREHGGYRLHFAIYE
jgi:hypothetical protein